MEKYRILSAAWRTWRAWRPSNLHSNLPVRLKHQLYINTMSTLADNYISRKGSEYQPSRFQGPQEMSPPNPSRTTLEPAPAMVRGDRASKSQEFCTWNFVMSYPRLVVDADQKKRVKRKHKLQLFEYSSWDFFALPYPGIADKEPILLVPSSQFRNYIDNLGSRLRLKLEIPEDGLGATFVTFGELGTPFPRFLGRASSRDEFRELKRRVHRLPADDLSQLSTDVLKEYREKFDGLYGDINGKGPPNTPKDAKPGPTEPGRLSIMQAQRYLGFQSRLKILLSSDPVTTDWNVDMLASLEQEGSVRFIAVDVEAWELSQNVITEVGLAVLDTRDTASVIAGEDGCGWFPLIKSYHFIIEEHKYMVNRRHIRGIPHLFNFGNSEFVSLYEINRVIGKIIGDTESHDQRPVVVVGHGVHDDIAYLKKVGYNIRKVPQFTHEIDTMLMFQYLEDSNTGRKLSVICERLGLSYRNLHNAGNDATYTLQAMIAIALREKARYTHPKT
ncbi:hypothetical protein K445DRAFT_374228 [Daldinia sp. EC12]|nr:hypothetical protein K445DRAFT_374228 [Daldinia sp. EC12]